MQPSVETETEAILWGCRCGQMPLEVRPEEHNGRRRAAFFAGRGQARVTIGLRLRICPLCSRPFLPIGWADFLALCAEGWI